VNLIGGHSDPAPRTQPRTAGRAAQAVRIIQTALDTTALLDMRTGGDMRAPA
jgi:hypothetical protein